MTPTTAVFSNGMLFIQGDNLGNNIDVSADSHGRHFSTVFSKKYKGRKI